MKDAIERDFGGVDALTKQLAEAGKEQFGSGWLCFESNTSKRRLYPVPAGWRVRPDAAAAGLWSTAADLSRVALEIRRAYLGEPSGLLTPDLAGQLLTASPGSFYGLGSIVDGTEPDLEYGHGGEPVGYRAMSYSRLRDGTGIVVLTNGDSGKEVVQWVATALGRPTHPGDGSAAPTPTAS